MDWLPDIRGSVCPPLGLVPAYCWDTSTLTLSPYQPAWRRHHQPASLPGPRQRQPAGPPPSACLEPSACHALSQPQQPVRRHTAQ